jgi:hypothetical protein
MRRYDEPLEEAGLIKDGDAGYVLTRVDQPQIPNGLGHAWAEPRLVVVPKEVVQS